jgi:hypothetical protein
VLAAAVATTPVLIKSRLEILFLSLLFMFLTS